MAATRTLADAASTLEKHINLIKYTTFCIAVIIWLLGAVLLGLCVAIRLDSGLEQWIDTLNIWEYYIGIYVLIFTGLLIIILPFFSCAAVYQEIIQLLIINAAGNMFCFLLLLLGSAILLENSTVNSGIQSSIQESMKRLIMMSYDPQISDQLNMIQEEVGCCGVDGPNDYLSLRKPLPNECRDTVTGNAYFHGCADEITWFLEDKSWWITGIALTTGSLHMLVAILSYILVKAIQKEEKLTYRR